MLIKKYKYLLGCTLAAFLVSCSSTSGPEPKPLPKFANEKTLTLKWVDSYIATSPAYQFVPVVEDNTIWTSDVKGNLFRIDPVDGTVINHHKTDRKLSSGTAVSSDSIFVTTDDAYLLSVSKATGNLKWQTQLPTISIEAPQVGGNVVVVRANNAELLAYDVHNGKLLWVYQKQNPLLTLRANNTFQVVGRDVVLFGQPNGRLALINLINGNTIWENFVAVPEGATDLDKLTDIAMRPVINDKLICVSTFNGKITCLDAVSSNILWSKKFSSSSGIIIDEQHVYSINTSGIVYAFDKNTGAIIWQNNILQERVLSAPVFLDGHILTIDSEGNINLLDAINGKLTASVKSNLRDGVSYPWSDGHKVFAQSANGYIAEIIK
jgi:outer membrane protein assembly factor BamB